MIRHPGTAAVVRRTALTAPLLSVFVVVVIAVLSFGVVLVPPLVDHARTAAVHHQIQAIPATGQALTASRPGIPGLGPETVPEPDVWAGPLAAADEARRAQPQPLRDLLEKPRVIGMWGSSALFADRSAPLNVVQLVMDPGLRDRSVLTQGRYPQVSDPAQGVEIVLTEQAAAKLDWKVGEVRRRPDGSGTIAVTLTGLVAPDGRDELDWDILIGARAPAVEYSPEGDIILHTVGFLAPDEARALGRRLIETTTFSWISVDPRAVDAGNAATLGGQLRLFLANPVPLAPSGGFYDRGLSYRTPLAESIDRGVRRGDALVAVVALAAVGPLAVAAVVLALAGRQLALRRSRAAALARARGASLRQLVLVLAGEALLLGLLGAVLGGGIATALSSRLPDAPALLVVALLVLTPVCTVPLAAVAGLHRIGRTDRERRRPWLRLLGEAVVLVLAVVLGWVLLGRGQGPRVDPVLLAVPLLVGAAGTVLVQRLLPLLLDGLHRSASRRTGLIALLGPARALRDAALRTAPALAAVVGIAVAVFSVSFAATVSEGTARAAREATGADVAVTMPVIEDAQIRAARALPGVAAVATLDADEIGKGSSDRAQDRVRVYALDRDAFVRVQRDSEAALPLPASLKSASGRSVPVVASEAAIAAFGDGFSVNGHAVRVVAETDRPAPFGNAERWVIVDRANIDRIGIASPVVSRMFVAVAAGHDPGAVAKALGMRLGAGADVTTAERIIAQAAADPAASALRIALSAATAVVAALLALAILQTLLLGSASRARLLALLRAVGYPRRGEFPLVAWEVGPALVVALPVGVACGYAMSWLVMGALDLRGFTGGQGAPTLSVPVGGLAAVLLGLLGVTEAAVLCATAAAVRFRSAEAIRVADDG